MIIGILTSVERRHRYFVNRVRAAFSVTAVVYESTGYVQSDVGLRELTPDEARIVQAHFAERARQEQRFFGDDAEFVTPSKACAALTLDPGTLNSDATLRFLESAGVDTVVVFGTNLIKGRLLARWPGRLINLHLGLSPYYRGTATNFYPLLNEEPEYVGATIHLLDSGIDSGPILRHARPTIVSDDRPHTIGCKAIGVGIDAVIAVLHELDHGCASSVAQWEVPNARAYLRKDYHPRQVVELYDKLERGLISRYLKRAARETAEIRLVL